MTLAEIRRLCETATPGPWSVSVRSNDGRDQVSLIAPEGSDYTKESGCFICHTPNGKRHHKRGIHDHNAQFIAAARTLMPILLEVAEGAKYALDGYKEYDEIMLGGGPLRESLKKLEEV